MILRAIIQPSTACDTNICEKRALTDTATCCPQVEAELKRLAQIYEIYVLHVDTVQRYGSTLWAELSIVQLMDSTASTSAKLKHLAPAVSGVPAYVTLAAEVQAFADALPLMQELKSDALR